MAMPLRTVLLVLLVRISSSELATDHCSEDSALEYIRSDEYANMLPDRILKDDLKSALMHGWWTVAEELIQRGRDAGVSMTSVVYQAKSKINNKMKEMTRLLKSKAVSVISPAFEWAQSPDMVMLNVKLAHKLDTPATLDCVASDKTVSFSSKRISFKANCARTNKAFVLELDLWGNIDPDSSTWTFGSVGRVNINLKKDDQIVWRRLLSAKKNKYKPGNMHTWWAVQAKHDSELAELGRLNKEKKEKEKEKVVDSDANSTDANTTGESTAIPDDVPDTDAPKETPTGEVDGAAEGEAVDSGGENSDKSRMTFKKKRKRKKKKKKKKKKKNKSKDATGAEDKGESKPPKVKPPKVDL